MPVNTYFGNYVFSIKNTICQLSTTIHMAQIPNTTYLIRIRINKAGPALTIMYGIQGKQRYEGVQCDAQVK